MSKSPQFNQQIEPKQCKREVEEICIQQKLAPSQLKINGGFHAR